MDTKLIVGVAVLAVLVVLVVVAAVVVTTRRAVAGAVAAARRQQALDHDASLRAAVEHVDLLQRAHREAQAAGESARVTGALDAVRGELQRELERLRSIVAAVGDASAQRFGQLDEALRQQAAVSGQLAASTASLSEALANPQARGRWGERMAEDVLRLAGFIENVNYRKQRAVDGGRGRPDFTFELPKGHVLYMDVKFPLAAYLRYLEAGSDSERAEHLKAFLRDVRARVRELSARRYADAERPTVDNVLLFLPNEQLTGFIHEHDAALLDDALRQNVVLCSPMTLFAFLGVIRQAFDNFVIEQTSDEILQLVGEFGTQWGRYLESTEKLGRHIRQLGDEYERLSTTRQRTVERPLRQLDALRRQRGGEPDVAQAPADGGDGPGTRQRLDGLGELIRPGESDDLDPDRGECGGRVVAAGTADETPSRHVSAVV